MRVDSKGKYYTKIVSTSQLPVIVSLRSGDMIRGHVHIRPEKRLSDELNDEHSFLSITGATVERDGELLYETSYIAVFRPSIDWVLPQDAIGEIEEFDDEES
jgi:hypothetical protein